MKVEWIKETLAYNLKYLRGEEGWSQTELATKSGVSYRLIQELEAAKGNPTLETVSELAEAFKVNLCSFAELSFIRTSLDEKVFLERFKAAFDNLDIGVGIRNPTGLALWGNKPAEKMTAQMNFEEAPASLLDAYTHDARGVLKSQFKSEKRGIVYPYTIFHRNNDSKEQKCFRCYPTLILPKKGRKPFMIAVYMAELGRQGERHYYEYCHTLLQLSRE